MPGEEMILDLSRTHRLGGRAFLLFLSRHVRIPFIGLLFFGALWFERNLAFGNYAAERDYVLEVALAVMAGLFVLKGARAWFEYRGYAYRFDDEFFHISRGYWSRNEIGLVYHHIQTVTIKRDPMDRVIGVGHLIILLTGGDLRRPSEVILPALDRRKAELVQKELLRKARYNSPIFADSRGPVSPGG